MLLRVSLWIPILAALLSLETWPRSTGPQIVPLIAETMDELVKLQLSDPNIVSSYPLPDGTQLLSLNRQPLLRFSEYPPKIKESFSRITELLQKLVLPTDPQQKIYFALIDSPQVNAYYQRLPSNTSVIGINLGLLGYLKTDDELAFVLSHELTHGISNATDHSQRIGEPFWKRMLIRRPAENEADVRGTFERVHRIKMNPHAGLRLFNRLLKDFGDDLSHTHSTTSSRIHTLSETLTLMRKNGEELKLDDDRFYQKQILESLQTELLGDKEKLRQLRLKRIHSFLNSIEPEIFLEYYEEVRDLSKSPPIYPKFSASLFSFENIIDNLSLDSFSKDEKIQFYIELNQRLDTAADQAREKVLGKDYVAKSPKELERLLILEDREYYVLNDDGENNKHPAVLALRAKHRNRLQNIYKTNFQVFLKGDDVYKALREFILTSDPKTYDFLTDDPYPYLKVANQAMKSKKNFSDDSLFNFFFPDLGHDNENVLNAFLKDSFLKDKEKAYEVLKEAFRIYLDKTRENKSLIHYTLRNSNKNKVLNPLAKEVMADPQIKNQVLALMRSRLEKKLHFWEHKAFELKEGEPGYHRLKQPDFANDLVFYLEELHQFKANNILTEADEKASEPFHQRIKKSIIEIKRKDLRQKGASEPWLNSPEFEEMWKAVLVMYQPKESFEFFYGKDQKNALALFQKTLKALAEDPKKLNFMVENGFVQGWPQFKLENVYFWFKQHFSQQELLETLAPFAHRFYKANSESLPNLSQEDYRELSAFYRKLLHYSIEKLPERPEILEAALQRSHIDENFEKKVKNILLKQFEAIAKKHGNLPIDQAIEKTLEEFWTPIMDHYLLSGIASKNTRLLFTGNIRTDFELYRSYSKARETFRKRHQKDSSDIYIDPAPILDHIKKGKLAKVSTPVLFDVFQYLVKAKKPTPETDKLFSFLFRALETDAGLRQKLLDAALIQMLFYDETKRQLSQWQLEQLHKLSQIKSQPHWDGPVRPEINEIAATLEKQFPEPSALKNTIINEIEDRLTTNDLENQLLSRQKLQIENWHQSKTAVFVDTPHLFVKILKTKEDIYNLLEYLIGIKSKIPKLEIDEFSYDQTLKAEEYLDLNERAKGNRYKEIQRTIQERLPDAKRYFTEAHPLARTHALQPILEGEKGLLATPELEARISRLILGEYADNAIVKKIFDHYFSSIPKHEKPVLYGYILGRFADSPDRKHSIKPLFEVMGPFGIKAAQFLRTSGLAPPEMRAELNDFFDRALKSDRQEIIARLKAVLDDKIANVEFLGSLVGSGSINYVVQADVADPATGKPKKVVVRFLREKVLGQVRNENQIWEKLIASLLTDPDPQVRKAAQLCDDARQYVYQKLGPDGVELDLERERRLFEKAQRAYAQPEKQGSFRIEVAKPIQSIQNLIPEQYKASVSIYEYIPNTRLTEIQPEALRKQVATQILQSELDAMLIGHVFDPDGHPGNWLIDLEGKRLVRIDYPQLREMSPTEAQQIKASIKALLWPPPTEGNIKILAENFNALFNTSEKLSQDELVTGIREVLKSRGYPPPTDLQARVFYLRERLESYFESKFKQSTPFTLRLKDTAQDVFASIAKIHYYKEIIGSDSFSRRFLEGFGMDYPTYRSAYLKYKALHFPSEVAGTVADAVGSAAKATARGVSTAVSGASSGLSSGASSACNVFRRLTGLILQRGYR